MAINTRFFIIVSGLFLLLSEHGFLAMAQDPDPQELRKEILAEARSLKSIYKTDEAIEKLSALVKPGAMDEEVLSELADCHFQSGDYETAAGTYFLLSSHTPGNILYKIRMMQTYSRLKAFPQSVQAGREALQLDSIPAVVTFVGDTFLQMEQADSALSYYKRSLALRPGNGTVIAKAMNIMIANKDYDEAISLAKPFLAEDPDNTTVAPLLGLAYYRKGDYEEASKVFQRQEDVGNDTYPIHYYLGQSYWHTKTMYRAGEELYAAWQIDSSDVNLAYSIAAVLTDSYSPFDREVKPWLDKAMEMLQPDPAILSRLHQQYGLGYYRRQHSWDKAIEHYKEAYRYNSSFISALSTIAYCYEQKKDYKQALEWYEKYLKVARPGSSGYEFAVKSIDYIKGELFMEEK
ncbi:MAG: tetratricopeptide repeat protein [Bacteroidales bacterium]|nr:tetratricopeptide repeat protein [Bacteroidales bacterium]MBR5072354.1 tetratricopeptide repeat protein [Bacteroidales bacterium]